MAYDSHVQEEQNMKQLVENRYTGLHFMFPPLPYAIIRCSICQIRCLSQVLCYVWCMLMQTIVENMRMNNEGRQIDAARVKGFPSLEEANVWLLENPEMTGRLPPFDFYSVYSVCSHLCMHEEHIV